MPILRAWDANILARGALGLDLLLLGTFYADA